MDTVRYYVALFLVLSMPGVFLFWFSIHPFIRFWRRVGPRLTLAIHYGGAVLLAAAVFLIREPLLSVEFGTDPVLISLAVPIFAFAGVLRLRLSRQLRTKILIGIPELAPEKHQSKLLTEGIYSRLRHPRYVELLLAVLAYTLFCNYLAVYVIFLASIVWMFPVTWVEEKELRDRFGTEYESYCALVPRFVPKFRGD